MTTTLAPTFDLGAARWRRFKVALTNSAGRMGTLHFRVPDFPGIDREAKAWAEEVNALADRIVITETRIAELQAELKEYPALHLRATEEAVLAGEPIPRDESARITDELENAQRELVALGKVQVRKVLEGGEAWFRAASEVEPELRKGLAARVAKLRPTLFKAVESARDLRDMVALVEWLDSPGLGAPRPRPWKVEDALAEALSVAESYSVVEP